MSETLRRRLVRITDFAIPWGVGILIALTVWEERSPNSWFDLGLGLGLGAVQGGALRWRRSHPETVMGIALVFGAVTLAVAPEIVLPVAGFFAIGSLTAARPPRVSIPALAGLVALAAGNFLTDAPAGDTFFAMAVSVGAWALGEVQRNRSTAIEEASRRAVGEEQARIARELHDVIAHSVSVIVVQAAAADDVFDSRPDEARAALRSIETSGREAMLELRRLLAAVRPGTDGDTHPQPGLDRLDELVAPLRAGGLDVVVRQEGQPLALAPGIDLSAYRIVQEALTNTLRHSHAASAEVTIRFGADALELEIRDDGAGAKPGAGDGGHGILGMRERAALLGGTLEAGPLAQGGFRVHARLPVEREA